MGMGVGIMTALRQRERQLVSRLAHAEEMGREGAYVDSAIEELPIVRAMIIAAEEQMKVQSEAKGGVVPKHKKVVTDATPHCSECGRPLTTPESIARGIGPECYRHKQRRKEK